jgi:hypothetical protein
MTTSKTVFVTNAKRGSKVYEVTRAHYEAYKDQLTLVDANGKAIKAETKSA